MWGNKRKISQTASIKWHMKPLQLQIKLQVINLIQKNEKSQRGHTTNIQSLLRIRESENQT